MNSADDITPQGDRIRKAIKWLGERALCEPGLCRRELLEQAELRFNLTPRECEFLDHNFSNGVVETGQDKKH